MSFDGNDSGRAIRNPPRSGCLDPQGRREPEEIRAARYFADMNGMRALLAFLMEERCGGRCVLCQPVTHEIACTC